MAGSRAVGEVSANSLQVSRYMLLLLFIIVTVKVDTRLYHPEVIVAGLILKRGSVSEGYHYWCETCEESLKGASGRLIPRYC